MRKQVANICGRACQKYKNQQNKEESRVEIGQHCNAISQTGYCRQIIKNEHASDNANVHHGRRLDTGKCLDACGELHGAIAQAACYCAGQREGRPRVKCSCPLAIRCILAKNRYQTSGCLKRHALIQNHVSENHTHDNTSCIGSKAPLQEAVYHRPHQGSVGTGSQSGRWIRLHGKQQRFCGAPEHNACTDAGAKRNAKPLQVCKFRFCIWPAQSDFAKRRDHKYNTYDDHEQTYQRGKPAQSPHQIVHNQVVQNIIEFFCIHNNGYEHQRKQHDGDRHDGPSYFSFFFCSHNYILLSVVSPQYIGCFSEQYTSSFFPFS